jgi:hypothetical protein
LYTEIGLPYSNPRPYLIHTKMMLQSRPFNKKEGRKEGLRNKPYTPKLDVPTLIIAIYNPHKLMLSSNFFNS